MKKRVLSVLLVIVMLLGMMPTTVLAAGTDLTVDNAATYTTVDINDQPLGSGNVTTLTLYLQTTYAKVNVASATQDGTTIEIVLQEDTDPAAAIQVAASGTGLSYPQKHTGNTLTLANGAGTTTYIFTANGSSVTYTINFTTAGNAGEGDGDGGETVEPADPIGITMTFANKGEIVEVGSKKIYNVDVTVSDANEDGKLTIGEAFAAFHEQWYTGENGYAETSNDSVTGWVTDFWGLGSLRFSYALNYGWAKSTQTEIEDGDQLTAYFGRASDYSDLLTWFDKDSYKAQVGTAKEFSVNGISIYKSGESKNATAVPSGATVTVYDSTGVAVDGLATTTDANGKFSLNFSEAGDYSIVVDGTCNYICNDVTTSGAPVVPAYCEVTVEAAEEPEEPATLTITTDLSEEEVKYTEGDTAAALTVAAAQSKGEAVTYQWYKNTTKSTEGAVAIATGSNYIPSTGNPGTTYYYAVATCGELKATSKIATVTVEAAEEPAEPVTIPSGACTNYTVDFTVTGATVKSAKTTPNGNGGTLELVVTNVTGNVVVTPNFSKLSNFAKVSASACTLDVSSGSASGSMPVSGITNRPEGVIGTWTVNVTVSGGAAEEPEEPEEPAASLPINGHIVDIEDVAFTAHSVTELIVYLQGSFAEVPVAHATQDGTTIDVTLDSSVNPSAALFAGFTVTGNTFPKPSAKNNTCTLVNGCGTVTPSIVLNGTDLVTYTINFTIEGMDGGAEEEEPATLTITTDLSEEEVKYTEGAAATALTVAATQSKGADVTYQWYKNTTKSTEGAVAIATGGNYIPSTEKPGTTYYYAVATCGDLKVTSKIATITVVEAPATLTITTDLSEEEVKYTEGATATALTVAATQSKGADVTYQWYQNTAKSTEGATAITGATAASYTPSTAAAGTTYYYAVATCGELTATSQIAMVTVEKLVSITFTTDLSEGEVKYVEGAAAVALSVVTNPSDGVSYQWYKNTTKSTDGAAAIEGATSASYTPATDALGTTYYYVVAAYEELTASSKIVTVTVEEAPSLPLVDNVIDITDYTVWSKNSDYAKATAIKISGATVEKATEAGTTVNIVLDGITNPSATISVEFLTALKDGRMSGHTGTVKLENGKATLTMTLKGMDKYRDYWYGTVTYTLNFSLGEAPTEVPTRLQVSDSAETRVRIPVELDLSKYFSNATYYHLVNGNQLTALDSTTYTFQSAEVGTHTLVFTASNAAGTCADSVTVTVTVTEMTSGLLLDITAGPGSVDYVLFSDPNGNQIPGLTAELDGTTINVGVPRNYDLSGKIKATFTLTQSNGYPKLSTNNSFNSTNDTKVYTTTLSGGAGKATMYLYTKTPSATSNNYTTYTINYAMANNAPELTGDAAKSDTGVAGTAYTLNVPTLFKDADGDTLTYKVSVDGAAAVAAELDENGIYSYTTQDAGTHTLVFTAYDAYNGVSETYTLTLEIANTTATYDVTVAVPAGVTPTFYYTADAQEGTTLEATAANNVYTVKVPANVSAISWRYDGMGMSTAVSAENNSLTLYRTEYIVMAGENIDTGAVVTVKYGDLTALGKNNTFLLLSTGSYTVSVQAGPAYTAGWKNVTLTNQTAVAGEVYIDLESKEIPFTVPYFADLYVCKANERQGLPTEEIQPTKIGVTDFASDTRTDMYNLQNGTVYEYRVSVPGNDQYVTFVGMFKKTDSTTGITVTEAQIEDGSNGRTTVDHSLTPYSSAETLDMANVADLYMNVNAQGYLKLSQGQTKDLYTARSWWATNCGGWAMNTYRFLEPDYHYTVIGLDGKSGSDVVTIDEKGKITAVGDGTAIVLVTYDAMNVDIDDALYREAGPESPWNDGFFSAIWPENTGVFVVSVGAGASGITTGMTINENKGTPSKTAGKNLDAEHDVIYFLGDQGEYTFTPGTEGVTVSVANPTISGSTMSIGGFRTVSANADGTVTVPLTHGRNIVKVAKGDAAEYQVITAKHVNVTVNGKSLDEAVVEPGEAVSIVFDTIYNPVNRLAIYNTGAAVVYSDISGWDGKTAGNYSGGMGFYFFASHAPHQTVANFNQVGNDGSSYGNYAVNLGDTLVVPEDFDEPYFTLSDGSFYVSGFSKFTFGQHRTVMGQAPSSGGSSNIYSYFGQLPEISIRTTNYVEPEEPVVLESIAVTKQPTKTTYTVGESFNPADMVVTATYSDKSTKAVTGYTCAPETFTAAGTQTVTISYTEGGVTKTATVNVTVEEAEVSVTLSGITVTKQPTKTMYNIGEKFDPTGMVVTATYSDGTTKTITDYTYPTAALSKTTKTVTISYEDVTTTVAITMNVVEKIAVTTQPTKTTYTEGETFDPAGMVVTATYTDGTTKEITTYTYTPTGALTLDNTTVVITYTGEDSTATKRTSLRITVEEKTETELAAITVSMSFVNAGKIVVYNAPVKVVDADGDGTYTISDAFVALHEAYYSGGASGYAEMSNASLTGWVTKFWGKGSSGFCYVLNNSWTSSTKVSISSGDSISAFFSQDLITYSDLYTWFSADSYSAVTGTAKTLTVNGMNVMGSGASGDLKAAPKGATVTVYDKNGKVVSGLGTTVDANGQFTITFTEVGTYTVEVSGTASYGNYSNAPVVPSRCTVKVTEGQATEEETEETVDGAAGLVFSDVKQSDYYYDAVVWAVKQGITTGMTSTTFAPNANCTRAQMVTFLWRAAGQPAAGDVRMTFKDVDRNAYYYQALLWAISEGITTGITETSFAPNATCTRAQMVTFLYRMAGKPTVTAKHGFEDVSAEDYYNTAVAWAVQQGITTGMTETTFAPAAFCTRGQTVTFLYRMLAEKEQ